MKAIYKNTYREIFRSPGRFLAILMIIILGSGFFVGLRVSQKGMLRTGERYLDAQRFFDFSLASTLGFTEEDVEAFSSLAGVSSAEGSVQADALMSVGDSADEHAFAVYSLPRLVNLPDVTKGRLPEAADECLADNHSGLRPGDVLRLSEGNADDTLELFSGREFTVTGLCTSPLYLNYERGGTSIGQGSISAFLYVGPGALDTELFTGVYLRMEAMPAPYSEADEYEKRADALEPLVTALLEERASLRYEKLLSEANEELADAWKELEDAKLELSDARRELDDGYAELAKNRADYEEGLRQYEDGLAAWEAGLAQLNAFPEELINASAELSAQRTALAAMKAQLDATRETLSDAETQLSDAERTLAEGETSYGEGLAEYENGLAEYEDAHAEIARLERPDTFTLGRRTNLGFGCFENDSTIVKSVSAVFPLFFFAIAALICVTTVTRMVDEQRSQLGVLMALGYSRGAIMSKFLIYSGVATVVGSVVGILLGSWLIPLVVWQAYKIMYYFSDSIAFYFDWPLSIATFAAYCAAMLLVTWSSCRKELNETPANVIRPKPPRLGKRVLLERIGFLWNRLSFMWKVSLRNLFRYKQRAAMMILGVAGCTALMVTGFGIKDSITGVVGAQYSEITFYDMAVTFSGDLPAEQEATLRAELSDGDALLLLNQTTVDASSGKNEKEVYLNVFDEGDELGHFLSFHEGDRTIPFPQKGGALINSALAEALNVKKGGTITVRAEDWNLTVTVEDIYDNYIYNYVVIGAETFEAQCGRTAERNTAYIVSNGSQTSELARELLGLDFVLNVSETTAMQSRIESMLQSLDYIVLLTIVCAAALAFTVIYNLTNINITERLREIATVKVLGFYDLESAVYVLRENIVMTLFGAAAGIPLGMALNAFVIAQINVDLISFVPVVRPPSFLYSVALTLVFSLLVDFFMFFRLRRINTAEALKAAE